MTSRSIEKVVPATQGHITRLIGTVDMEGKGTNHPLAEVDPFILLDYGSISKNDMPPFGAHPHRGHSVVTIILQGKVKSWDSFSNQEETMSAPGSYWVDAGSGLFHDEKSVIDDENDPNQHFKLFQLWVGVREADRKKPPRVQKQEDLPREDLMDADNKVVGKIVHHVGPQTKIETPHPIHVAHVRQSKNSTYHHDLDPTHGGFIVHMSGKPSFGGTIPMNDMDVLVLKKGGRRLEITTNEQSDAEYLVCSGELNKEHWVKKLVASGAIIAASEEEAKELAPKVEAMSAAGKQEGGSFAPFGV
eukprot:CAMPEP_0178748158 /NCGR_PEP_ID=MMETSP0744-20121128/8736_1 /TAXON_ID=913974 /ORGANISM="Nitzschia punctata, Strain CCMP561" /LENGTH=302 /DNA_ID=CAMNT_0020401503 /DNA_START=124 /DNA_END=1032 /DNA_ORIENTATION=-